MITLPTRDAKPNRQWIVESGGQNRVLISPAESASPRWEQELTAEEAETLANILLMFAREARARP